MNWAFVDSLRLNYFTGIWGQSDNDAIDIGDRTQENSPYNVIITRGTLREHRAIRYCDVGGESEGRGQEQRDDRFFF